MKNTHNDDNNAVSGQLRASALIHHDAASEPEDTITLVNRNDPERLTFDVSSIFTLEGEEPSVLNKHPLVLDLTSHPGKALGAPETRFEKAGEWTYKPLILVNAREELGNDGATGIRPWSFDGKWVSTVLHDEDEDHTFVLNVWGGNIEERRRITVMRGGNEGRTLIETPPDDKEGWNRRAFMLNSDGSVSPKDNPELFLGRRGSSIKRELLIEAVNLHNITRVRQLLKDGADVDAEAWPIRADKFNDCFCALSQACYLGDFVMAKTLIIEGHANVDPRNVSRTPLVLACQEGHTKIVNLLLDNKADPTFKDYRGDTALCRSTKAAHTECMSILLDRCKNINIQWGIEKSMHNRNQESFAILLENKAYLNLGFEAKNDIICKACKMGLDNGLPFVRTILQKHGDLRAIHAVRNIDRELGGTPTMDVFIRAYADLSVNELSHCIARACIKYSSPSNVDKKHDYNPLLLCFFLAKEAKKSWDLVRRSDTSSAESFLKVYTRLQLGATALLQEVSQDTTTIAGGDRLVVEQSKVKKLERFLDIESSKKALKVALRIQGRTFFSHSLLQEYITRRWYGDLIYDFLFKPNYSQLSKCYQITGIAILLAIQLPLLPLVGYFPLEFHRHLLGDVGTGDLNAGQHELQTVDVDVPMDTFEDNIEDESNGMNATIIRMKSKQLFLLSVPFIMFLFQLIIDLAFAILFTFINVEWLQSAEKWKLFLLLFAFGSSLVQEVIDMCIYKKGLKTYFVVNPFNRIDLPGLASATLTFLITLTFPSNSPGIVATTNVLLSLSTIFLWLRMLRFLTLFQSIGPLTLMIFKMITNVCKWLLLVIFFVLAFASGVTKFDLRGDEQCSNLSTLLPFGVFFRDVIAGDGALFDCKDQETGFGRVIILISFVLGNVLLLNMLIAIMAESFSSVWESQEAKSVFQRAVQCTDMIDQKFDPFPFLSGPYGIYLFLSSYCLKIKPEDEDPELSSNKHDFKGSEKELSSRFAEFMKDNWRLSLKKQVVDVNDRMVKMEDKLDDLARFIKKDTLQAEVSSNAN